MRTIVDGLDDHIEWVSNTTAFHSRDIMQNEWTAIGTVRMGVVLHFRVCVDLDTVLSVLQYFWNIELWSATAWNLLRISDGIDINYYSWISKQEHQSKLIDTVQASRKEIRWLWVLVHCLRCMMFNIIRNLDSVSLILLSFCLTSG